MKYFFMLIIITGLLILNSSTGIAQGNSPYYQSYALAPVTSDTNYIQMEMQKVPQITGWDIGGQLTLSLLSGTIFSIGGALIGDLLSSGSSGIPPEAFYGLLIGYSIGVPIGVYSVASSKKYNPNLLGLIGSSIVGEIAGLYILEKLGSPGWPSLFLPPIFAIVTLNTFMQKKTNIQVGFDVQQLPQPNVYSYGMKLQYVF